MFQIKSQVFPENWQGQTLEQVNIVGCWSPLLFLFNFDISAMMVVILICLPIIVLISSKKHGSCTHSIINANYESLLCIHHLL